MLIEYATKTDYLFDQNVVKTVLSLVAENTHFGLDADDNVTEVYVDVKGLILSLDKQFVQKSKKSSVASGAFFVNPRLFFTIGTSTGVFLNHNNLLDNSTTPSTSYRSITLAAEKIGFRVKLWDGGYTHSFAPGELFKFHGSNRVWTEPQRTPLISSVYYNLYGSGLLYNILNLKTDKNFSQAFVASNIGVTFFNGLEFSTGIGMAYENGLAVRNSFWKIDFDIPIIDYLTALAQKKSK